MSIIVGHKRVDTGEIICESCASNIYVDGDFVPIYEREAVMGNLQCDICGCPVVDPDSYYDSNLMDECPNCGRDQYFLEAYADGSVECVCGWCSNSLCGEDE